MEFVAAELLIPSVGVAFATLLAMAGIFAAIGLVSMGERESAGAVFPWAEWPLPESVPPTEEAGLRRAA